LGSIQNNKNKYNTDEAENIQDSEIINQDKSTSIKGETITRKLVIDEIGLIDSTEIDQMFYNGNDLQLNNEEEDKILARLKQLESNTPESKNEVDKIFSKNMSKVLMKQLIDIKN